MSDSMLELRSISLSLGGKRLVDIDHRVGPGDILTVMGPSGSGKSSLLAYVAGFLEPAFTASGEIVVNGKNITALPPEQRRIGLLFQDPLLFPHLSVEGNLRFGLDANSKDKSQLIRQGLEEVGLSGFESRDPGTLSGGQKSRIALLRLLLSTPRAVLLDEPFSKLDSELRQEIRSLVFDRLRSSGLPTLLVTHDQADADAAGGDVHLLS